MKNILNKVLKFFNIVPDDNQKWLLLSMFMNGFLITYASPTLTKSIISELPAEWIAFESLFSALSGLLIGMLWKEKVRSKAISTFQILAMSESIIGCLLCFYLAFVEYNVWTFAIISLVYTNLITSFVGKCIMAFKAKMWNEKDREVYDNNLSIVSSIVCIIGFTAALCLLPSIKIILKFNTKATKFF